MTREEAIEILKETVSVKEIYTERFLEAYNIAIEALKAEPKYLYDAETDKFVILPCEDAVKREAVLNTLDTMDKALDEDRTVESYKELLKECYKELPPVTPKPTECEDAVSREAVLNYIRDNYRRWFINDDAFMQCVNGIKNIVPVTPKQRWIPVSERLPEDFGTYLITLENGDVCWCEFNPDYIDEEHDKGAFTYYHEYYDNYTLGLIDSEECAVDAIAWRTLEPYKAESEE